MIFCACDRAADMAAGVAALDGEEEKRRDKGRRKVLNAMVAVVSVFWRLRNKTRVVKTGERWTCR